MTSLSEAFDAAAVIIPDLPAELSKAVGAHVQDGIGNALGAGVLTFVTGVAFGVAAELLVSRSTRRLSEILHLAEGVRHHTRFAIASLRFLIGLISLGLFALAALVVIRSLSIEETAPRTISESLLLCVVALRLIRTISYFIFSPNLDSLRLFSIDKFSAKKLNKIMTSFGGILTTFVGIYYFLYGSGVTHQKLMVLSGLFGIFTMLILIILVWVYRSFISGIIESMAGEPNERNFNVTHFFAHSWHIFATAALAVSGSVWAANMVLSRTSEAMAVLLGLLIILLFPMVDRSAHACISWIVGHHIKPGGTDSDERAQKVARVFQGGTRVILGSFVVLLLAEAWGANISEALSTEAGRKIIGGVVEIAIILATALVGWDLFKHLLAQWFPDDDRGPAQPGEGEGGGAGSTRMETLVPLVRSFIFIVLVVMVTMVTLDAAGVNIGPLLAGAGVVGLALGFGAQKLVQDVLSGVFFLIDDAFRKGEYIETNDLRGTVERISLRSIQLRHHRGPLQTIPFSEIQYVRNHSRDWVIMKLEFRVPYDTDIEQLRKTIKKLGLELMEDERLGPSFIEPLKSQGVLRMEHTALVVRMKFTAIPGEQWVLRKEIYRRVQERLRAEGFQFARPVVSVKIEEASSPDARQEAAAGAAAESLSQEPPYQTTNQQGS